MGFTLRKSSDVAAGVVALVLEGQVTSACQGTNPFPFEGFLGAGWASQRVLVDMERVDYLDSAAVGWLIASQKAFHAAGGKLVLYSLQPRIRQLLTMLKLERIVPLAEDLAAAKQVLG